MLQIVTRIRARILKPFLVHSDKLTRLESSQLKPELEVSRIKRTDRKRLAGFVNHNVMQILFESTGLEAESTHWLVLRRKPEN